MVNQLRLNKRTMEVSESPLITCVVTLQLILQGFKNITDVDSSKEAQEIYFSEQNNDREEIHPMPQRGYQAINAFCAHKCPSVYGAGINLFL